MYMRFDFQFKKRVIIFFSLILSFLISWIIISPEVGKSFVNFGSRLNSTVETFLAGITVKKTVTDKVLTNSLSNIDFTAVSPTLKIILPTKSLFLRPTTVQPSIIKPSKTPVPLYRPSPTKIPLPTKVPPRIPSPTKSLVPRATAIPTPKVVSYRNPLGLPPPSSKIHDLAVEIGQKVGVPPALVLTAMNIETGDKFYSRDNAYIEQYSKPGASLPFSYSECSLTQCGESGPMQMTVGYDSYGDTKCTRCTYPTAQGSCPANAWGGVSEQVESLVGSSSVSPCNIRENMYGAAIKMKNDSTYVTATTKYGGVIDTDCAPFIKSKPIVDGMKWNQKAVYLTGCHYHGSCFTRYPRLNNRTYCEILWDALPPEHKIL